MSLKLFDAKSIHLLGKKGREGGSVPYLETLVKKGVDHFFQNISADLQLLKVGSHLLPVLIPEQKENAYVCSPYHHYIAYGLKFSKEMKLPFLRYCGTPFMKKFGQLVRIGQIEKVVYVNHWLFSTDLYPEDFSKGEIFAIVSFLKKKYPDLAIVFRSLNPLINEGLMADLQEMGFNLIASRQVHLTDTRNEELFQTRIHKSDLRLWNKTGFQIEEKEKLSKEEVTDVLKLYNVHNISGHSSLNPQPNQRFLFLQDHYLRFKMIKNNKRLLGVAGYYEKDGVMVCPFFGYDPSFSEHTTIYRLLSTALLLEAKKRQLIFHQSAGATFYKQVRRAKSCIESMAVYSEHLPLKQRVSWKMLKTVINLFGPRFMRKY